MTIQKYSPQMSIRFNGILQDHELDPKDIRLVRHKDQRSSRGRSPYELWRDEPDAFHGYQSSQRIAESLSDGRKQKDKHGWPRRAFDDIMIERLWRTIKYEEFYLNHCTSVSDCRNALRRYFEFYNHERRHQTFGYRTPWEMYQSGV